MVAGSMASLKVATTFLLMATLASPPAGAVKVTRGAVTSRVTAVEKLQVKARASGTPAKVLAAVEMVTW
jgi:hypothetical protein